MKILVTGGAGFIGSHLTERLVEEGHEVVVLDDFSSGSEANLSNVRDRVRVIRGSLLDIAQYSSELEGTRRVYHLAALISGYDSLYAPEDYQEINIVGLLRLIDVARHWERPQIVFASSSTVYGNSPSPIKCEETPACPLTIYALTKYMGERTLELYRSLYSIDWVALRLFNVYGPRQSPDHPYANVTCKFAHAAAHGNGVALYGDGEQTRDFVYVTDVVDAFMAVSPGAAHRIYNVGTGSDVSILELLSTAQELAVGELPVDRRDPWPNDIRRICADVSRLEGEFGFRPRVGIAEGLARTVEFFRRETR